MITLNPYTVPLKSINLIEASAGTGKSWTVSLLYLRLILEKHLNVDQILVVTFTDAATKELRDTIRKRLVEALEYFQNPELDALVEYKNLFKVSAKTDDALKESLGRLKRAKLSIDEAAIFTIHSFCQRVLTEYAFEASLPFESELMDDDRELMQKITDDYWRRNFNKAPKTLIYKLKQKSITPDSLLDEIAPFVGKPYLEISGPKDSNISNQQWDRLENSLKKVMELWKTDACDITQLVLKNKNLNGNKYRANTVEKNCTQFSAINSLADINKELVEKDLKRYKASSLKTGTKDNCEVPCHPFFELWESFSDLWEEVEASVDGFLSQIKIDLLKHLQEALPKEKKRLGVLAFDDLLLQLQSALNKNSDLAENLRDKYQAALIDEFQDTDPVQYDIFSTIYNDPHSPNPVFLVGDPKQAIYSFRGGDIYTYLLAKQTVLKENQYTLKTNYRSHTKLIQAYNTLYGQSDNPFHDKGIDYVEVSSGKDLNDVKEFKGKSPRPPLQFWLCNQEKGETADPLKARIANAVAGDICRQLNQKICIEGREVCGGDFAILVRSHTQGNIIKKALAECGIASIQSSKKTIFETHEAEEMLSLLTAIIEPQREDSIRRALVTELIGKTANDLEGFDENPNLWEEQLVNFQTWHFQWKKQGFLPMMRDLMQTCKMHQHLLSFTDGERRLTNVLHLSELIHRVMRQQSFSMQEVLRWLKKQQILSAMKEGELRLESDDNLVKIVTIHKSKGLEYSILYCPFVALGGKSFTDKVYAYHKDKKVYLELGSVQADEHKELKKEEIRAEESRLLYVALTRAKYQCTVVSLPTHNKDTALGWLITNGQLVADKKAFNEAYIQNLQHLEKNSNGTIGVINIEDVETSTSYQNKEQQQTLIAREFTKAIKLQAKVTSFSGLTAGSHDSKYEAPDYDANATPAVIVKPQDNEFPRGATAGTALHEIFENLDFEQPVEAQQEVIENSLNKWGFDKKHTEAATVLMQQSLQAELFEGFSLNQLIKTNRLDEMEFYLPLERINVEDLKQILFKYLPDNWQVVRDAVETLNFDEVEGFLKGYIDLIFEHQGQYYVVDYKSNSLDDYAANSLLPVMADSHYYLQYLLYSVALHRYLKKRITDYSWQTHMGGAYYLFIRGLHKTAKKGGGDPFNGIFSHKPSLELINALDGLFAKSFI